MKLIIVSGLSGSGKSIALDTLEDSGYYCVDNLPISLFDSFIRDAVEQEQIDFQKLAVSIDARSPSKSLERFVASLQRVRELGIECEILFLTAELETLIKRFSETRRKHPLTNGSQPLTEAIAAENQLLDPIVRRANLVIDTTHTNIHQLRELIRERVGAKRDHRMSLYCLSFGYKNGLPTDADFTFDARCLPNPHWEPTLRAKTGLDRDVRDFLGAIPEVGHYLDDITHFLKRWAPRFRAENRNYLTIAIGCTGGQHRSVYLADALAQRLRKEPYDLLVRHRDLR